MGDAAACCGWWERGSPVQSLNCAGTAPGNGERAQEMAVGAAAISPWARQRALKIVQPNTDVKTTPLQKKKKQKKSQERAEDGAQGQRTHPHISVGRVAVSSRHKQLRSGRWQCHRVGREQRVPPSSHPHVSSLLSVRHSRDA